MQPDKRKSRNDLPSRPRYCPGCRLGDTEGLSLCPHCGETMHYQGYCAICESYWLMPVGSDCPKHEVALEAGPPKSLAWTPPGESPALVTVAAFSKEGQAEAARIRLEAEGIPTFLEGERMGTTSMYTVAIGGVKLQVPELLVADARVVLSQTWTPPLADDDFDDAWEELAAEPGMHRRTIMKALILLMLFGPLALVVIAYLLRGLNP